MVLSSWPLHFVFGHDVRTTRNTAPPAPTSFVRNSSTVSVSLGSSVEHSNGGAAETPSLTDAIAVSADRDVAGLSALPSCWPAMATVGGGLTKARRTNKTNIDKIFLGGSAKYVHFTDATSTTHTGFTFDAGLTLRPIPQLSIGAVGYNLLDRETPWAPRAVGGGVAVLPMPMLLLVFDSVLEKVYDNSGRDKVMYYMGGGEISFAASAAIRAGGGHDGLTKNSYVSAGFSLLSADIGALDIGLRQDVSGAKKTTIFGVSARLFVPTM